MGKIRLLYKQWNDSYHALFLVLGTSRGFLAADFLFMFDALIDPRFTGRKLAKIPWYLWGIVAVICVSAIWSAEWFPSVTTGIRVLILAAVLPTYKYGYKYKQFLGVVLIGLAFFTLAQSAFMVRSNGIHSSASMLGQMALVFAPIFWVQISLAVVVILTMSLARSPLAALILFAAITRKKYFFILGISAGILFIFYAALSTPGRITLSGFKDDLNTRVGTVTGLETEYLNTIYKERICGEFREAELRLFGYGWGGYCQETGQPRPHNIYVLSAYGLGILAVPFWGFILFGAYKFGFWRVAPLFALGLVTEELFGRPEGVYLIAIWIISIGLMGEPDEDVAGTLEKFG